MRRLGTTFLNHPLRDKAAAPAIRPERPVVTFTATPAPRRARTRSGTAALVRGLVAAVLAATVATSLTACGNGGSAQTLDGAPSAPVSPPAPSLRSVRAVEGPAAVVVLRVYRGYWAAQVRAMSTGHADGSDLSTYATGEALSESYADVVRLLASGLLMAGAPRSAPVVTAVGPLPGAPNESRATVQDCLDVSGWHQVSQHGGRISEPDHRLLRYPLVVTARTVGGAWMISQVTRETGKTC